MASEEITISGSDGGSFVAYVAKPNILPAPGLLVIQEIFGVNQVMRDIAESYAKAGYLAVVPDLFWRQKPGVQLSDKTEAEWNEALKLSQEFDEDQGVEDLIATLNLLRSMSVCKGKVGSVGFCLGGKLAFLMGTRSDADCNVSYYGVGIEKNLPELASIHNPFILHLAEDDEFISFDAQAHIIRAFNYHPVVALYSYPKEKHGFA
ncbi:MAG: dienelactone hydrolase family protein, partial [Okeania sp. SIO2D1]|nr:dienelactone hydrolase family protein [Okeania sp. SIO2D1]